MPNTNQLTVFSKLCSFEAAFIFCNCKKPAFFYLQLIKIKHSVRMIQSYIRSYEVLK